jgi:phosphatidylserine/phosphatidylglycerophosphate/cardiolipin synthase-like enzyme
MTHAPKIIALAALLLGSVGLADKPKPAPTIEVLFSPDGHCTDRIVAEINKAETSVRVQAYYFTSLRIAKAIVEAKERGAKCEVILDPSQEADGRSAADFLRRNGVRVYIDDKHAIAHNNVIIIDGTTVMTGSFNFTQAAEYDNAENVLIISGYPDVTDAYVRNFDRHKAHSREYGERTAVEAPSEAPSEPPAVEPRRQGPEPDDPIVYVTKGGRKYHRETCPYLRKSRIPMKLSEAKRAGYEPCSRCKPPE